MLHLRTLTSSIEPAGTLLYSHLHSEPLQTYKATTLSSSVVTAPKSHSPCPSRMPPSKSHRACLESVRLRSSSHYTRGFLVGAEA